MGYILLIRHGQTDGNKRRIVQPPTMGLSAVGAKQAGLLADRLYREGHQVKKIISSDLARAKETAQAVAERLRMEIEFESLLQERNFGDLRGKKYEYLLKKGIDILKKDYDPPGGESPEVFASRVKNAFQRIKAEAGKLEGDECLIFVTHGLVLTNLFELISAEEKKSGNIDPSSLDTKNIGNTSVTVVRVDGLLTFDRKVFTCVEHLLQKDLLGKKSKGYM